MFMPVPSPFSLSSSSSSSINKGQRSSPPTFGGFNNGWISYYRINYQEIKKLGRGAGGDAFLCRNMIDENLYAIKKINTKISEAARLKEEAVILRHLDHPNIVRYYQSWIEEAPLSEPFDIFEEDELSMSACVPSDDEEGNLQLFIAMEHCPLTLRKAIESGLHATRNLFYQLVKGVHYIHSKGMMHRDLNPNNIFLSNDGNIKIGDFGCSTRSGFDSCRDVGTSHYRAPEIDLEEYDSRMLFKMNTQMERHEVLQALRKGIFPRGFEENYSFEAQLIRQMLAPNPEDRVSTLHLLSVLKMKKTGSW